MIQKLGEARVSLLDLTAMHVEVFQAGLFRLPDSLKVVTVEAVVSPGMNGKVLGKSVLQHASSVWLLCSA